MQQFEAEKVSLGKDKIQSLLKYTQENKTKAIIQILNSFLPFIGIWIAMYLTLDISYWLTLGLGMINAFFLVRIFIIQHDCGHQSFIKNRRLQKIIGHVCSYVSLIPFKYWAKSHAVHHKLNGQLELRDIGDVNTYTVKEFSQFTKGQKIGYKIYRSPIVMFLIGPVYYLFIHNRLAKIKLPAFKKLKNGIYINNLVLLGIFLILGFSLGWTQFLTVHLTILTLFAIIAIWFFYVQHQHEHGYKQWKKDWDYITSALIGSTYYKVSPLFNWLTGNIGIHHVHHLNPAIPNYNLKQCIRENPWINDYPTIINFKNSLKLASYKLWDETQQKMITFKEFHKLENLGLTSAGSN